MEISFISPLGPEDEERIASMLIAAVGALLDQNAFPYTLRVKTSGMKLFQRTNAGTLATERRTVTAHTLKDALAIAVPKQQ